MYNDVQVQRAGMIPISLLEVISLTCHQSCTDVCPKASCAVQSEEKKQRRMVVNVGINFRARVGQREIPSTKKYGCC